MRHLGGAEPQQLLLRLHGLQAERHPFSTSSLLRSLRTSVCPIRYLQAAELREEALGLYEGHAVILPRPVLFCIWGIPTEAADGSAGWKVKFTGLTQNSEVDPEV